MGQQTSLSERIRGWLGLEEVNSDRFPFLSKLERAEEDVALIRLVVILVNGLAFLTQGVLGGPAPGVAIAILILAFGYAVATVLLQVRPAFGNVSWSIVTVGLDAVAISAWLVATGGWASPYFPLWYASIAAVGYRYNLPITNGVSTAYVGAYGALCLLTGGVGSWIEFGLRAAYIPLTGTIVGLASEGYVDAEHEHRDTRRRLHEVIRTMDHGFATVLADAPDRIVITDVEGRVEYANGPASELGFAAVRDEAQARGIHAGAIRRATETGEPVAYAASPTDVGAVDTFWCRVAALSDGGEPVGAVLIARAGPVDALRPAERSQGEQRPRTAGPDGTNRGSDRG